MIRMKLYILLILFLYESGNVSGDDAPYVCDFDEDYCHFTSDPEGNLKWERISGPTPADDSGPDEDHTSGTGSYIYIDARRAGKGDFARTIGPSLIGTKDICSTISFYYFMYGEDVGFLNLYLVQDTPPNIYDNPLWGIEGDQGFGWKKAEINVTFPENFKLIFEGITKQGLIGTEGDMAIDDLLVDVGKCEFIPCDPTTPWCQNGGTCLDISNGNESEDYYECQCAPGWEGVHCESDVDECASNPCDNGGTCTHGVNTFQCICALGYHGQQCEYIDFCLDPDVHRCENGATCYPVENDFNCSCVAGYTGQFCEVDIDECAAAPCAHGTCTDRVNGYICSCEQDWVGLDCDLHAGGCTFDAGVGTCRYSTVPVVDFMWEENQGSTPSFGTGPEMDHTTGTGTYMYADSQSRDNLDRALLYSPFVTSEAVGVCTEIKFWYYMSGSTVGTLNVYVSGTGNNELETNPVFTVVGEQGEKWIQASLNISSSVPYSIIFEAVCRNQVTYRGDIAIDDVTLTPNICEYLHCSGKPCQNGGTCFEDRETGFVCQCTEFWTGPTCAEDSNLCLSSPCQNNGICIDEHQDFRCECDSLHTGRRCEFWEGSCDFDIPFQPKCSYVDDDTGDFIWQVNSGKTPSAQTGPDSDHTTGTTGFYLYAEASDRTGGDKARILTPVIPESGSKCTQLSFWFITNGANVGELAVYLEFSGEPLASPVWTKVGDDKNGWTNVQMNISVPTDYLVVFEATMQNKPLIDTDNRGDIAIDDVIVTVNAECTYDKCFTQPCLNGGTCIFDSIAESSYKCICPGDYVGERCETFGQCDQNPCLNGGICSNGGDGSFQCLCPEGYIGSTCEEIDYCLGATCKNGATCTSQDTSFSCACVAGYEGRNCEQEIDECLPKNPCLNGGACIDQLNSYACDCLSTFVGDHCEKVSGSCEFEEQSFCGWQEDELSDFNWMINSGPGPSWPLNGPQNDHTYDTIGIGYYIFTSISHFNPPEGSLFRIRSPIFRFSDYEYNAFNIELYSFLKGSGIGMFNVYIQESEAPEHSIHQLEGEQGNGWKRFSANILVESDWSIILEHKTARSAVDLGDIAVDDVKITMLLPPTTTTLPSTSAPTTTIVTTTIPLSTTTQSPLITTQLTTTVVPKSTTSQQTLPITTATASSAVITTDGGVNKPSGNGGGLSGGATAGIVIGTLVGIALLLGLVYWQVVRPGKRQRLVRQQLYEKSYESGVENPTYAL